MAALLVQSLFPSGTMPGNLQNGWVATLCPEGMPVAFMAQLPGSMANVDVQAGPHAGHHSGHHSGHQGSHHGESAQDHSDRGTSLQSSNSHADHGADHQAVGDCQLGSQLDQPFALAVGYTPGTPVQVGPPTVQYWTAALAAGEIYRLRPRGPPLS